VDVGKKLDFQGRINSVCLLYLILARYPAVSREH
jgi:hypothetical protein